MKKYLFGFVAIVFAISIVAFTTSNAPRTDVFFKYKLTTFTEAQVENPANWEEVTSLGTCDGFNVKACRIKVDHTDTQGIAPSRTLLPGTSIIAALSGSTYHVTIAGDVLDKKNFSITQ